MERLRKLVCSALCLLATVGHLSAFLHLLLMLLLLPLSTLQAELATTQEALVCSQSQAAAAVDKAHNTLEAVMCRSRVLQADFDELRAAYMGMEQELGSTKVKVEGLHNKRAPMQWNRETLRHSR